MLATDATERRVAPKFSGSSFLRFFTYQGPEGDDSGWVSDEKAELALSNFFDSLTQVNRFGKQPDFGLVAGGSNSQIQSLGLSAAQFDRLETEAGLPLLKVSWFEEKGQYGREFTYGADGLPSALLLWLHSPDSFVHEMSCCLRVPLVGISAPSAGAGGAVMAYFDRSEGRADRVFSQLKDIGSMARAARPSPGQSGATAAPGVSAFGAVSALLGQHLRSIEQWRLLIDYRIRTMEDETGAHSQQLEHEPDRSHGLNLGRLIMGTQNQSTSLVSLEHVATWQRMATEFALESWAAYEEMCAGLRTSCNSSNTGVESSEPAAFANAGSACVRQQLQNQLSASVLCCNRVTGAQRRMQSQVSTLLGLVAQRDSRASILLARESRALAAAARRDSSVMRIIAILTSVFLPATLCASIFSTGIFNLGSLQPGDDRVSPLWWVYVLASCASTVVVMGAGYAFLRKDNED